MNSDEKQMKLAFQLAKLGEGNVNPNPMVGAIVVKNGEIIGRGFHKKYGGPHAEVFALDEAGKEAVGATLFVTLEPCSHYGKTPPCVNKIIDAGIKRCVIAILDPNHLVAGKGVKILKEAGIEITINVLKEVALEQNRVFFNYIKNSRPYLFLKCAITLDGKIATQSGDSKWISNSLARERVQELRNTYMGVIIGINTLLQDNPRLNCRIEQGNNPYRIVIDPNLKTSEESNFIQNNLDNKSIIVTSNKNIFEEKQIYFKKKYRIKFIFLDNKRFLLKDVLENLKKLEIDSVLLEGGSSIISMAFKEKLIDAGEIFIAPKIVGDEKAIPFIKGFNILNMRNCIDLKNIKYKIYDDNISIQFIL